MGLRRIVFVLCAVAGLGLLLFPTAGTPAAQQAVDTEDLELSPSTGPNGAYVAQTIDGEVRLDLTRRHPETGDQVGLNERAVTTFDRLLRVEYTGSGSARMWLETPTDAAYFYHETPSRAIDERDASIQVTSGERIYVGLVVDTTDPGSQLNQFDRFEVTIWKSSGGEGDSEEIPVTSPSADGPPQGGSEPEPNPEPEPEPDPEPEPEPPADGSQDDLSGPEQPPDPPERPPPDLDPGEDSASQPPETGTTDGDPPPERGETPDSAQIAVGGLGWVMLLVAAGILGMLGAAALRRRSTER